METKNEARERASARSPCRNVVENLARGPLPAYLPLSLFNWTRWLKHTHTVVDDLDLTFDLRYIESLAYYRRFPPCDCSKCVVCYFVELMLRMKYGDWSADVAGIYFNRFPLFFIRHGGYFLATIIRNALLPNDRNNRI